MEQEDNFIEPEERTLNYANDLRKDVKSRGYDMRRLSTLGKIQVDSQQGNSGMNAQEQLNNVAKPDPSDGFLFAEYSENAPRFMAPRPLDCKLGLTSANSQK